MKYSKIFTHPPAKTKRASKELQIIKTVWKKIFLSDYKPDIVFTLPGHALPSQFRTLLPLAKADGESMLELEKTKRRIKNITLALTSLLVIIIIAIIALIIALEVSIRESADNISLLMTPGRVNISKFDQTEIDVLKARALVRKTNAQAGFQYGSPTEKAPIQLTKGMKCYTRCFEYTAFRFKPACIDGYCRCQDTNYDDVTCLPKVKGCSIQKHEKHRSFMASHLGSPQSLYACSTETRSKPERKSAEIHIISIFGNLRPSETAIYLTSLLKVNVTLVLVTYEPLTWSIKIGQNINIRNIVLISNHHVSRTQATLSRLPLEEDSENSHVNRISKKRLHSSNSTPSSSPSDSSPDEDSHYKIIRMLTRTGYGDDRLIGSTPTLLNFVSQHIGVISRFVGTAHADLIKYQIDSNDFS